MYPNLTFDKNSMPPFKKKKYTEPIICNHRNDVYKDWYVFFRFKHEGKIHKFKRREGINRIKDLEQRLKEVETLLSEISYDLKNGWNPCLDPKREIDYNPYLRSANIEKFKKKSLPKQTKTKQFFYLKYFYQ